MDSALIADDSTAMGCALRGNVPMNVRKSSCTSVCRLTRSTKASSVAASGSSPWMRRYATSRKLDRSASCSIG
ncbi:Uncharacterised protein [Mycobacteroides abscessus]|nr:Uncharacterised protein [Mycobacteroides abscessus]